MSDYEKIYLQPECCVDPEFGRSWCDHPSPDDSGEEWTPYLREDLHVAEIEQLRAELAAEKIFSNTKDKLISDFEAELTAAREQIGRLEIQRMSAELAPLKAYFKCDAPLHEQVADELNRLQKVAHDQMQELIAAREQIGRLTAALTEIIDVAGSEGPEYHDQGMGCGLEDRGITDRYEAMYHGWEKAIDRASECWATPVYEIAKNAIESAGGGR